MISLLFDLLIYLVCVLIQLISCLLILELFLTLISLLTSFGYFVRGIKSFNIMICRVCDVLPSKYKCPRCRVPYCSLLCWKTHKEGKCESSYGKASDPNDCALVVGANLKATYKYPSDDTLPPEKLKLLEQSEKLKGILCNPHVRQKLAEVDSARDPSLAIQRAMLEPIFVEFADECMNILEPWTMEDLREERLLN